MHNFKKIRVILFLLIAAALFKMTDIMLYPCTFTRNDIHTAVTEEKQDIFIGTSHGKMGICPEEIENITHRTGHNLCVGGEYSVDAYHLIKLVSEKQKPERVIYEIDPRYYVTEKEPGNNYLLFYHEFPASFAKAEYFMNSMLKCDFRSVIFPWYEYPLQYELKNLKTTTLKKVTHSYNIEDFKGTTQEYHKDGFIECYPVDISDCEVQVPHVFEMEELKEQNIRYLKKLIRFCEEQGIEFVAVTTPVPEKTLQTYDENFNAAYDYFEEMFEDENIAYYNFNREYYKLASHKDYSFTDYDGHMNGDAAKVFSRVFAHFLKK